MPAPAASVAEESKASWILPWWAESGRASVLNPLPASNLGFCEGKTACDREAERGRLATAGGRRLASDVCRRSFAVDLDTRLLCG